VLQFLEGNQFGLLLLEVVLLLLDLVAVGSAGALALSLQVVRCVKRSDLEKDTYSVRIRANYLRDSGADRRGTGSPLLTAGEQPVDRPLLVHRQVVFVEPGGEVARIVSRDCSLLVEPRCRRCNFRFSPDVLRPRHADELNDPLVESSRIPNRFRAADTPSSSTRNVLYWLGSIRVSALA